ncbi:hypothetical protein BD309DRAFT_856971 [Dichomitus squalens]|nr:hypothetical protein BD309DRAFT_856971 [Dichomitus squalens]
MCILWNALSKLSLIPRLRARATSAKPLRTRSDICLLETFTVTRPRQTSPVLDVESFKASRRDSISEGGRCFAVRDVSAGSCPNTRSHCPKNGPPRVPSVSG